MAKITTDLFGSLALIPLQPERPVREVMEFLTDTSESYNGKEERYQLRAKGRQYFEYLIPQQAANLPDSFNTAYGNIRGKWAVPIWTEAQRLGVVSASSYEIVCDTSNFDIRESSLAMLYSDCNKWEILQTNEFTETGVSLRHQVQDTFNAPFLIPVRLADVRGNIEHVTSGHGGSQKYNFFVQDSRMIVEGPAGYGVAYGEYYGGIDISGSLYGYGTYYGYGYGGYAGIQYKGEDIYFEVPLQGSSRYFRKREDINDFDLGVVETRSPWLNTKFAVPYRAILEGAFELLDFKRFLFRRAGKCRPFWMPTFENNLRVVYEAGTIEDSIVVEGDSYLDYANRTNIAIKRIDNTWLAREVTSVSSVGSGRLRLFFDGPLNMKADELATASYMGLYRLDSDRIEFNHVGNNVCEVEIPLLELAP